VIPRTQGWRGHLRRRARDAGVRDGRGGAVTVPQRFGGALNMNSHFHALVMDGVFARDGDALRFHPTPSLDAADIAEILATIDAYLRPVLARRDAADRGVRHRRGVRAPAGTISGRT